MEVFWTSIQSVLTIITMIAIGYFANERGWFAEKFSESLSTLIMQIALPALIFTSMIDYFKPEQLSKLALGLLYTILSIAVGIVISWLVVKAMKIAKGRRGLIITAMNFANTGFIGMPLNEALFGSVSLPYLLVYYIINTIMLWTVGIWIIAADDPTATANGQKVAFDWRHLIPAPLWGVIAAIPFIFIPWLKGQLMASFVSTALSKVGALVTPLSLLIYIGIMLSSSGLKNMTFDRDVIVTLLGRFIMAPLLMAAPIYLGSRLGLTMIPLFYKTLIIQSATPTFAVLPILANIYHNDVKFATNIVVTSSVLFVIVVPVIMLMMG